MRLLCVLHEVGLRIEHHPAGFALELLNLLGCGLPRHRVRFLVLHQLGLGAELGSTRITLVLLSESEYQSSHTKGCRLFGCSPMAQVDDLNHSVWNPIAPFS